MNKGVDSLIKNFISFYFNTNSAKRQMPNKREGMVIIYYISSYPFTSIPIIIIYIIRGVLISYLAFGSFSIRHEYFSAEAGYWKISGGY